MITTVVMCNIMLLGDPGADAMCRTPKSARIIAKSISTSTAMRISQIFLFMFMPPLLLLIYIIIHTFLFVNPIFFTFWNSAHRLY